MVSSFFFNDTATTEIYTLSLHDALPICLPAGDSRTPGRPRATARRSGAPGPPDRKSTRLNSSHDQISYAVFCLKKKIRFAIRAAKWKMRTTKGVLLLLSALLLTGFLPPN